MLDEGMLGEDGEGSVQLGVLDEGKMGEEGRRDLGRGDGGRLRFMVVVGNI